ncbi:MAG: Hpt domain-containing protein [Rubripirellula sp.]|nr:Hpt domain-containing protein [Rubripirellula sp.]
MIFQINTAGERNPDALNRGELIDRLMGNAVLAQRMVSQFIDSVPGEIDLLESTIRMGNQKEIATLAHRHQGTAKTLAAPRVAEAASEIECLAGKGSISDLLSALDELRLAHGQLRQELEDWATDAIDGASE